MCKGAGGRRNRGDMRGQADTRLKTTTVGMLRQSCCCEMGWWGCAKRKEFNEPPAGVQAQIYITCLGQTMEAPPPRVAQMHPRLQHKRWTLSVSPGARAHLTGNKLPLPARTPRFQPPFQNIRPPHEGASGGAL
eukprot:3757484-Pyramimonas_sp.AAC.1